MLMARIANLRDERGTTLMELTVGLAAGAVVFLALTSLVIGSLHGTARVSARVDATQRARTVMTRLTEELHSACIAPQVAPVQAGSTGTLLSFIHQTGSSVAPVPIRSNVSLTGTTLTQEDFQVSNGTAPKWTFKKEAFSKRQLMTGIAPTSPSTSIFGYYGYSEGKLVAISTLVPLSEESASKAVQVNIAFTASPRINPARDKRAAAAISDSVQFRLTPASYNKELASPPCQ
jgi:Flp pilus assembly pilin Flp